MENLRILPHQLPAPGYNLSVKEFPILYAPHFGLWDLTTKTYLPLCIFDPKMVDGCCHICNDLKMELI